jgi:hypothetical protein
MAKVCAGESYYVEDIDMDQSQMDFRKEAFFRAGMPPDLPFEDPADSEDLLPEFVHYRDEGCKFAPSCLECPFPFCVEDERWARLSLPKKQRNEVIVRLYDVEKKSVRELAAFFGVSLRTIERALAGGGQRKTGPDLAL